MMGLSGAAAIAYAGGALGQVGPLGRAAPSPRASGWARPVPAGQLPGDTPPWTARAGEATGARTVSAQQEAGQQEETPGMTIPRRVMHRTPMTAQDLAEWAAFRSRFIAGDGRVVDTGNGSVSHSEGQGWGMLFAVAFNDPATFDLLHGWTRQNLRRSGDHLHAWRYLPQAANHVPDQNAAIDGDLFIAAALWRAAWQWGREPLAREAAAIARDILSLAVRDSGAGTVLLPGVVGFETKQALTVNLSYYAFPFLEELSTAFPSPQWAHLRQDGQAMLRQARFGAWNLPPDWLSVSRQTGALAPHPNWPARFSYDAIRIPLWQAWSGAASGDIAQQFSRYWSHRQDATPAWIDLETNAAATYAAPSGMRAVARIAASVSQRDVKAPLPNGFPALHASPDYYSAALILLSRLAWRESCDM